METKIIDIENTMEMKTHMLKLWSAAKAIFR